MTTEDAQAPHPIDPVPTTGDGLLVWLSGETVAAIANSRGVYKNGKAKPYAILRQALDAVQRAIEAAERADDDFAVDNGPNAIATDAYHYAPPSYSTTTGDTPEPKQFTDGSRSRNF